MAVQQVNAMQLGELLGSLLRSIIAAQEESSRATIEFVETFGLAEPDADGGDRALRTVTMRFRKKDADGQTTDFEVEVPLLALVNAPSLSVAEARLEFGYQILATSQPVDEPPTEALSPGASLTHPAPVVLRGIVRSPQRETPPPGQVDSSFSVEVNVLVRQEAMPLGVQRLFDLAELGITERPVDPAPGSPP